MTLEQLLDWMYRHGSSVILNGAIDDGFWEASWITGGERYNGYADTPLKALEDARQKAWTPDDEAATSGW